MHARLRSAPTAFWLASGAVAWMAAFTVWVLTASVYEPSGQTVLQANDELSVRLVVFAPLVLSALAWLALHRACLRGSRAARTLGSGAASLLLAFAVLTGFTIGTFFLPGAIALAVAAALTPMA
jgi:hypothetical protein